MPCPTCSHTLHAVATGPNSENVHHCPRCGTLVRTAGEWVSADVPKLVKRAREFTTLLVHFGNGVTKGAWVAAGVAECLGGTAKPDPPEAA